MDAEHRILWRENLRLSSGPVNFCKTGVMMLTTQETARSKYCV